MPHRHPHHAEHLALRAVPLVVVAVSALLAALRLWPFEPSHGAADRSFWQFLLGDRVTLGAVRFSATALALFAVVSVVGLAAAGRWLSSFGNGIQADPVRENNIQMRGIQTASTTQLRTMTRERDAYRSAWLRSERDLAALQGQHAASLTTEDR